MRKVARWLRRLIKTQRCIKVNKNQSAKQCKHRHVNFSFNKLNSIGGHESTAGTFTRYFRIIQFNSNKKTILEIFYFYF